MESITPHGRSDIAADARRALTVIANGGIAVIPGDVGYGILASNSDALIRVFNTKNRAPNKRHGMVGSYDHHREIHRVDDRAREIIDTIALDYQLPLSIVAPYDPDNRFIRQLDERTLKGSTVDGTISIAVNQGVFYSHFGKLALDAGISILGSSANMTGTGIKARVEDIDPEILDLADIVIDYGLCRYHSYRRAGSLINFATMQVIRTGACYDIVADILQRRFGLDVPAPVPYDDLPSGILWEPPVAA